MEIEIKKIEELQKLTSKADELLKELNDVLNQINEIGIDITVKP